MRAPSLGLSLTIASAILVGCRHDRALPEPPGEPTAPPPRVWGIEALANTEGRVATTHAVELRFEIDPFAPAPPELLAFLEPFFRALARGDHAAALGYFEPDNRAAQRELGITDAQYIIEGLGVSRANHLGGPALSGPTSYETLLADLRRITVSGIRPMVDGMGHPMEGWAEVIGELEFGSGTRYRMRVSIRRGATGWSLAPPLG